MSRTEPTQQFTARDYATLEDLPVLNGLNDDQTEAVLSAVERRGSDIARRLGVDKGDKLPAFIWAMAFAAHERDLRGRG